MIDVKKVQAEAEAEVREELGKKAKEEIKRILRQINSAEAVVQGLKRELADACAELGKSS